MNLTSRSDLRGVMLLWTALLVLGFGGRMYSTDVVAQYEVAGSFIGQRPLLTVSGEYGWVVSGAGPGHFVPHNIGYSILLIPAALFGDMFGIDAGKISTAAINASLSLVLIGFWFTVVRRKYGEVPVYRFILVAIGGMALIYGKMPFDVTAAAAAIMAGLYLSGAGKMFSAGLCMGLAVLIRVDSLLLLPLFWNGWVSFRRFLAGVTPFIVLTACANWYRFGSPLIDGHGRDPAMAIEPFRGGITGLFLSPGKGLLYYAPLCVFALFYQKEWRYVTPFVISLVLHGMLHDWTGGTGWGPRFLFVTLPFLLFPLCKKGTGKKLFWIVAAAGVAATLPAIWCNVSSLEQSLGPDLFDDAGRQAVIWNYSSSPIFNAFGNIGRGIPDLFGASAASSAGFSVWVGVLVQLGIAILLAIPGIRLVRGSSGWKAAA